MFISIIFGRYSSKGYVHSMYFFIVFVVYSVEPLDSQGDFIVYPCSVVVVVVIDVGADGDRHVQTSSPLNTLGR